MPRSSVCSGFAAQNGHPPPVPSFRRPFTGSDVRPGRPSRSSCDDGLLLMSPAAADFTSGSGRFFQEDFAERFFSRARLRPSRAWRLPAPRLARSRPIGSARVRRRRVRSRTPASESIDAAMARRVTGGPEDGIGGDRYSSTGLGRLQRQEETQKEGNLRDR